jgi:hypothetical protein
MTDSSQISRGTHRILAGSWTGASQSGAALVLVLGVIGQWVDSPTYPNRIVGIEIHALFGVSLCAAVFIQFYRSMKHAPLAASQDIAKFSRSFSRKIYLLMYVLLGLRLAMGLDRPLPRPAEGFRDYLIGGVLALILVRVLAARWIRAAGFTPLESRPHAESL